MSWEDHPILVRQDGSYVIVKNGHPYHVPNEGEWEELWKEVKKYAKAHPAQVEAEPLPPPPTLEEVAKQRRAERDALISACDYLIMPDYPLAPERRAVWEAYRQALRDVPAQEGFPREVNWPAKPE